MRKINYTKKYKSITYYHTKDFKDVEREGASGIVYRILNKEEIEKSLSNTKNVIMPKINNDFPELNIYIKEINIYHKFRSKYKYIDIIVDVVSD